MWKECNISLLETNKEKPWDTEPFLLQEMRFVRERAKTLLDVQPFFQLEWGLCPALVFVALPPQWGFRIWDIQGVAFLVFSALWNFILTLVSHAQTFSQSCISIWEYTTVYVTQSTDCSSGNYLGNWSEYLCLYWNKWEEKVIVSSWYLFCQAYWSIKSTPKCLNSFFETLISCELLKDKDEEKCITC